MINDVTGKLPSIILKMIADQAEYEYSQAAKTRHAADVLSRHMAHNGEDSLDPNKLYEMAQNVNGELPKAVADAARFMLTNPDIYAKLENRNAADGKAASEVASFDFAARGGLEEVGEGKVGGTAEEAAANLGAYMRQNNIATMDPNKLFELAMRPSGDTPPGVSNAAKFMLQNPDDYAKIETHDVAGSDGVSGASNFDAAVLGRVKNLGQNGLDIPPEAKPVLKSIEDLLKSAGGKFLEELVEKLTKELEELLRALLQNQGAQKVGAPSVEGGEVDGGEVGDKQGGGQTAMDGIAQLAEKALQMLQALLTQSQPDTQTDAKHMTGQQAAGELAGHLEQTGKGTLNVNDLYKLAEGGRASPQLAEAATFMLQNPEVFKAIETHDNKNVDGISGASNFNAAAKGDVSGVEGKHKAAIGHSLQQVMEETLKELQAQLQETLQRQQPALSQFEVRQRAA